MRKDYMTMTADAAGEDEDAFVERHWTEVWERAGGMKQQLERIPRKEEFRRMAPYLERLPRGARILDGGCGIGEWVLALNERGFETVGLDISRATIAQLRERFPKAEFVAGDIRDTGFESGSFDAYFSWGVFEHFEAGPQDCIAEALRILKPGGLLFASTPLDNLRHSVRGAVARPRPANGATRFYQYRFTRAEWAMELSRGGFEVLECRPIHKRQGVLRSLHHNLGLPYEWLLTRGLSVALSPIVPGTGVAHMVMAIARKPAGDA